MNRQLARLAAAAACVTMLLTTQAPGYSTRDFADGVNFNSNASPSVQESQINDYRQMRDQLDVKVDSGNVRVLRTDQKALLNDFVTELVEVKNVNPRELRGLARTICRKEGGDADVLYDKVAKKNYIVVVCPNFQLPYVRKTLQALDQEWIKEVNDGSWILYYKGKNRDVRNVMDILQFYRTPDWVSDFDDPNNAVVILDQPCIAPLINRGFKEVDIPPSVVTLETEIYEVDTQNDLGVGFDFESWKNGPGRALWELIWWDYDGNDVETIFPGSVPMDGEDWGRFRSYDVTVTTAYLDFLQSRGKARLVNRAFMAVKSGMTADLAAVDEIASLEIRSALPGANPGATPSSISGDSIYQLSELYKRYYEDGKVFPSLPSLLAQQDTGAATAADVINALMAFLEDVIHVSAEASVQLRNELSGKAADGYISYGDCRSTRVPAPAILNTFRDRTLQYLESGQVGILLSVLPVVGLETANLSLALDISEVAGLTPSNQPIIEHRYVASSFDIADGQPLILGGITRTATVTSRNGIPFLSDLPMWAGGFLFGRDLTTRRAKEIIVKVTPRFKVHAMDGGDIPEPIATAKMIVEGKKDLKIPQTAFGFDQWLLDDLAR